MKHFFERILILALFSVAYLGIAAPLGPEGRPSEIKNPDGTAIPVRIFGDEFYGWCESLEGYTLIFDKSTQQWCYATQNETKELVPSACVFGKDVPVGIKKKLRDTPEKIQKEINANYELLVERSEIGKRQMESKLNRLVQIGAPAKLIENGVAAYNAKYVSDSELHPLQYNAVNATLSYKGIKKSFGGNHYGDLPSEIYGLTLFVSFKDDPDSFVPVENLTQLLNQENYNENGYTGSVYDYFYAQSNGKLKLKQICPPGYVRLDKTYAYYESLNIMDDTLPADALVKLEAQYPEFVNSDTYKKITLTGPCARSFSILYNGVAPTSHASALWPHRSTGLAIDGYVGGLDFDNYQVSDIGKRPSIGTFCHESGHMVCNFSDYYDLNYKSKGLGFHSLMGNGNINNNENSPADLGAYLKFLMGWVSPVEIQSGEQLLTLDSASVHIFRKPGSRTEYFLLENRYVARESDDPFRYHLPDHGGIAIWHIDETQNGNNSYQMTPSAHYECSLEQADGLFHLEKNISHTLGDYFSSTSQQTFDDFSTPNAHWWPNDAPSNFSIRGMSGPAPSVDVIVSANLEPLPAPVFSVNATVITNPVTVAIVSPDSRAHISYSLDGSFPSIAYSEPITIPSTATTTLTAVAICSGYASSYASATYIVNDSIQVTSPIGKIQPDATGAVPLKFKSNITIGQSLDLKNVSNTSILTKTFYNPSRGSSYNESWEGYSQLPTQNLCHFMIYGNKTAKTDEIILASTYFECGKLQEITLTSSENLDLSVNATSTIMATGGASGAPLKYYSDDWRVADVSASGVITAKKVGTARILVIQESAGEYLSADPKVVTVTVNPSAPLEQTVTITGPAILGLGTPDQFSATTTSGLPVTWSMTAGEQNATIHPTTGFLTPLKAGNITLKASVEASTGYNAAFAIQEITIVSNYPKATEVEVTATKEGVTLGYATDLGRAYSILRSDAKDGVYTQVETGFTGGTFLDNTAVPGKKYFYKLRAE